MKKSSFTFCGTLAIVHLIFLISPISCSDAKNVRGEGSTQLQSKIDEVIRFFERQLMTTDSEDDESDIAEVKKVVEGLQDTNAKLNEIGSKLPQEAIDELTKYIDDVLVDTRDLKGKRQKRGFFKKLWGKIKNIVRKAWVFIDTFYGIVKPWIQRG